MNLVDRTIELIERFERETLVASKSKALKDVVGDKHARPCRGTFRQLQRPVDQFQPYDRISLNQIISAANKDGYKTNMFIEQIVLSKQFRYRQGR